MPPGVLGTAMGILVRMSWECGNWTGLPEYPSEPLFAIAARQGCRDTESDVHAPGDPPFACPEPRITAEPFCRCAGSQRVEPVGDQPESDEEQTQPEDLRADAASGYIGELGQKRQEEEGGLGIEHVHHDPDAISPKDAEIGSPPITSDNVPPPMGTSGGLHGHSGTGGCTVTFASGAQRLSASQMNPPAIGHGHRDAFVCSTPFGISDESTIRDSCP